MRPQSTCNCTQYLTASLTLQDGKGSRAETATVPENSSQPVACGMKVEDSSSIASAAVLPTSENQKVDSEEADSEDDHSNPEEAPSEDAHSVEAHSEEASVQSTEALDDVVPTTVPAEASQDDASGSGIAVSAPPPPADSRKLVSTAPLVVLVP